jgi:hypothetical protein
MRQFDGTSRQLRSKVLGEHKNQCSVYEPVAEFEFCSAPEYCRSAIQAACHFHQFRV